MVRNVVAVRYGRRVLDLVKVLEDVGPHSNVQVSSLIHIHLFLKKKGGGALLDSRCCQVTAAQHERSGPLDVQQASTAGDQKEGMCLVLLLLFYSLTNFFFKKKQKHIIK